jgi:hypothetical protein
MTGAGEPMPINLPSRDALRREFDAAIIELDEDRRGNARTPLALPPISIGASGQRV